ncbi:AbiV family abortive infection protein [Methylomonas rosea]|uniref:AbiV family abortive infection protein n=1 Tax=Methylomonas rosea TaxID=2952227 RepID=A0ABT1TP84_9GAMM|nr:AbiV family abortive infection protein [Methylomonas sp. WSC-7]MCQ8116297.1 AbiV family abortive infection protein [Methylomonas sp. WSC-7]
MKHRAIKDLNQLADNDCYREISQGLDAIYENCIELNRSYRFLVEAEHFRASRVLKLVLKEEAAKYLILVDALRCPRKNKIEFARQLGKFNDHLAKGLYAELCNWKPDTYSRLCEYIENSLDSLYLDGPNGVDFIFRNRIISEREETFYVDYAKGDDSYFWLSPKSYDISDELSLSFSSNMSVVRMVMALHNIGITRMENLILFSNFWRDFVFDESTRYQIFREANYNFLQILESKGALKDNEASDSDFSLIINDLPFPLYKEEMKVKEVNLNDLKEQQRNWSPDYY